MSDWMTELEDELKNKPTEAPAAVEPEPTEAPAPVEPEPTEAPAEAGPEATEAQPVEETPAPVVAGEEPTPQQRAPMIPKSRLDEEIEKRRKAETDLTTAKQLIQQFLAQTQQQQQPQTQQKPAEPDLDDVLVELASKEHAALMEGDVESAKEIRKQSNKLLVEQARREAYSAAQYTTSANAEDMAFQQSLEAATRAYPIFDANSPDYDETLSNMALAIGQGLAAQGVPKSRIIYATLEQMKPVLDMRQQPAALEPQAAPAPIKNVAAKVAASRAQPPATQSAGSTQRAAAKLDVMSMTVEDFEKLPQDEINKLLRGG
jgi:hypothetical protein